VNDRYQGGVGVYSVAQESKGGLGLERHAVCLSYPTSSTYSLSLYR